jgi:succinoglycan biosynthesis protein ExoA
MMILMDCESISYKTKLIFQFMSSPQTISVIAPCRNEKTYIRAFCAGVLSQVLPLGWQLQLVIADGLSNDGTRQTLQEMADADTRIQWISNDARIVSSGLNAAYAQSVGEVIVRMDIHTEYARDYIAQCIAVLAETGADNVGGAWRAEAAPGAGALQQAVAAAFQSKWVAGGAASRDLNHNGWVDTVYLGSWPRASLDRFGLFDETLVRNQDDEHNLRITCGGGKIWQSARIQSVYRPRASWWSLVHQYLQYGYWKPFVMRKHGRPASPRHLAPALLIVGFVVLGFVSLIGPRWPLIGWAALYGLAVFAMTFGVLREKKLPVLAALCVPLVILAYHLSYGLGSQLGVWDGWVKRKPRAFFSVLTR